MSYTFNPFTGNFDATSDVTSLADIDRLTSITATAGDTMILTSDGVVETLSFSRGRVVINQSGGTNRLTLASSGVGIGVAPASIGATLHVEGTELFNLTDAHANPLDITVGGVPYIRFVTSAGARTLEFRGNVKLSNVDCNWDGHFLPTDLSSNFDIGGTPSNYWRNAYFVGTVYATGGLSSVASATQAASILLKADAAQNATMNIQDSSSNNLFSIDVANSNVTFNVDEVIVMDGTRTRIKMGQVAGSPDQSHIVLYDGNDPGSPVWWIYSQAAASLVGNWVTANNFYTYHAPGGDTTNAGYMSFNTGVGTHFWLQTDAQGGVGFASRCILAFIHGECTNAGNTSSQIKLQALERMGASSGPLLEIAYGASWGTSLATDERVRFNAQGVTSTQWALGAAGESYQARDAHIVSDTYGLMLGAGTGGGGGDARLYHDGTNVALDNLIGSGFFDVGMGLKSTAYVNAYETSTSGAFNALASGTTRPGLFVKTGGSTTEVVMAMNSGGYAYGSMYGWYMMIDESSTGDWWLKAGDGGAPVDMLRCYRGTRKLSVGGDTFGTSTNGSLAVTGQIYARRGTHFNYDQYNSANYGNFVWSSSGNVYMIYGDALNNAVGFGTTATTGGTLNYAAGRTSTNKAGTFISCAGVSDNFLLWFSANAYAGAGGYGWGYVQEEASYGDHQFMRQDGGALTNVLYYKRSNGYVGVGSGWTGASPPLYQLDVKGKIHTDQLSSAYSVSNVGTDRTYDASSTTVDELADVLGTLITDLKTVGIIP